MTRWLFMLLAILLFIAQPVSADTLTSGNCAGGTSSSAGCAVVTVSGYGTVGIQITGTFTGTLSFEQTNDDTNWVAMTVYNVTAPSTGVTTATGPGLFTGSAAGIKRVRVRFSAYTSGSAIVSPIKTDARSAPPSTSGGSGAPTDATYITQTANGSLSAEQALGSLATGLMNSTTTTGVVSTLAPTDDNLVVGSGAAWQLKALTTCTGTGKAVTYDASSNSFGCNTISGGSPAGSGSELQYRVDASTFGGITGSSVSGSDVTLGGFLEGPSFGGNDNDADGHTGVLFLGRGLFARDDDQTWLGDSGNPAFFSSGGTFTFYKSSTRQIAIDPTADYGRLTFSKSASPLVSWEANQPGFQAHADVEGTVTVMAMNESVVEGSQAVIEAMVEDYASQIYLTANLTGTPNRLDSTNGLVISLHGPAMYTDAPAVIAVAPGAGFDGNPIGLTASDATDDGMMTPKNGGNVTLTPGAAVNGGTTGSVVISTLSGTGVQFACLDATGKLVRSATACGS
jgi:hypothetical protein